MKKILLALMVASASSLFAGYANWFTATPGAETPTWEWTGEDGSIITNTTATTPYWEIDADVTKAGGDDATLFTPTGSAPKENTVTIVDIKTTFDAMYDMSEGGEDAPLAPPADSLGALIVGSVTNSEEEVVSSNFYAYVNSAWVPLYGADVPSCLTGDVVNVRIELLYMGSASAGVNKLRYSVLSDDQTPVVTVLTNAAGVSLFEFTPGSTKQLAKVQFSGCGKVTGIESKVRDTEDFDGGSGSEEEPYLISYPDTFLELGVTGKYGSGKWLKFMDNFTLKGFAPIFPSSAEAMNVQGNNKTLTVELTGNSFFGKLANCTIKDLTINASNASDNSSPAAVFASECSANEFGGVKFENCTAGGHIYDTTADTGKLAGFTLAANASAAADTSVTFENCIVTANLEAANKYAFVADITQGIVTNADDTVLATVGGYESYGTKTANGAVACAFNFCTNDTIDEVAYSFYVVPDLGGSYIVKKPSADNFFFDAAGEVEFNGVDEITEPEYTGTVAEGQDYVLSTGHSTFKQKYIVKPCVALMTYSLTEDEITTYYTNKYASLASALEASEGALAEDEMVSLYTKLSNVVTLDNVEAASVNSVLDLNGGTLLLTNGTTLVVGGVLESRRSLMRDVVMSNDSKIVLKAEGGESSINVTGSPWITSDVWVTPQDPDEDPYVDFSGIGLAGLVYGTAEITEANGIRNYRFQHVQMLDEYETEYYESDMAITASAEDFAGFGTDTFTLGTGATNIFTGAGCDKAFVLGKFDAVDSDPVGEAVPLCVTSFMDDTTVKYTVGTPICSVTHSSSTKNYASLDDAVYFATAGDTITLLADYTVGANKTIDKNITINCGEFAFTVSGDAKLTIAGDVAFTKGTAGSLVLTGPISVAAGKTLNLEALPVNTGSITLPATAMLIGASDKTAGDYAGLVPTTGAFFKAGATGTKMKYDGTAWVEATALQGTGAEDDPWLIQSYDDLVTLKNGIAANNQYAAAGKFFKQTVDIDFTGKDPWAGIGNSTTAFAGIYNGDRHSITNLTLTKKAGYTVSVKYCHGFFNIANNMSISNLTIHCLGYDSSEVASSFGGAILVGQTTGGRIENVIVDGDLLGAEYTVGALVGSHASGTTLTFANVTNKANVSTTYDKVGGFIAYEAWSPVVFENCANEGTLTVNFDGTKPDAFPAQFIASSGSTSATFKNCVAKGATVVNIVSGTPTINTPAAFIACQTADLKNDRRIIGLGGNVAPADVAPFNFTPGTRTTQTGFFSLVDGDMVTYYTAAEVAANLGTYGIVVTNAENIILTGASDVLTLVDSGTSAAPLYTGKVDGDATHLATDEWAGTSHTFTIVPAVAKIGDAKFATFAAAVEAAEDGNTIKLFAATAGDDITIGANVTIDLNGYALTIADNKTLTVSTGKTLTIGSTADSGNSVSGLITVDGSLDLSGLTSAEATGAKFAINAAGSVKYVAGVTDTPNKLQSTASIFTSPAAGAKFTTVSDAKPAVEQLYNYANGIWAAGADPAIVKTTVNGVEEGYSIFADALAAASADGKIVLLAATSTGAVTFDKNLSITNNGATVAMTVNGAFTVNAGKVVDLSGFATSDVTFSDGSFALKAGATLVWAGVDPTTLGSVFTGTEEGALFKGTKNYEYKSGAWSEVIDFICEMGGVQYKTLAEAIADVQADNIQTTITMIVDCAIDFDSGVRNTITTGKKIALDLNGKTITINKANAGQGTWMKVSSGAELTMKTSVAGGSVVYNGGASAVNYMFDNYGVLNVESGYYELNVGFYIAYILQQDCHGTYTSSTTFNFTGGTFNMKSGDQAIRFYNNSASTPKNNTINIDGGVIQAGGIFIDNCGTTVDSVINLKSGSIAGVLDFANCGDYMKVNILGGTVDCSKLQFRDNCTNTKPIFTVKGGTVKVDELKALCANTPIAVRGGTYDATTKGLLNGYLASNNYSWQDNGDETWTAKLDWLWQIAGSDTKYATLMEAIAAGANGDTIKLLESETICGVSSTNGYAKIAKGQTRTIDWNGNVLTFAGDWTVDKNAKDNWVQQLNFIYVADGASLTLKDSVGNGGCTVKKRTSAQSTDNDANWMFYCFGTIVFDGGTYIHEGDGTYYDYIVSFYTQDGVHVSMTINNGTFVAGDTAFRPQIGGPGTNPGEVIMTMNNGSVTSARGIMFQPTSSPNKGKWIQNGGTYTAKKYAAYAWPNTDVSESCVFEVNGGTLTVLENDNAHASLVTTYLLQYGMSGSMKASNAVLVNLNGGNINLNGNPIIRTDDLPSKDPLTFCTASLTGGTYDENVNTKYAGYVPGYCEVKVDQPAAGYSQIEYIQVPFTVAMTAEKVTGCDWTVNDAAHTEQQTVKFGDVVKITSVTYGDGYLPKAPYVKDYSQTISAQDIIDHKVGPTTIIWTIDAMKDLIKEGDTYLIEDADSLAILRDGVATNRFVAGQKFKQTGNINLGTLAWNGIGQSGSAPSVKFCGVYDGQGNKITVNNMAIQKYTGFFGSTGDGAAISNLTIACNFSSDADEFGSAIFIGCIAGATVLENCTAEGSIRGTHGMAGFAANVNGAGSYKFISCTNKASIIADYSRAAGFVAMDQSADTDNYYYNCENSGTVQLNKNAGAGDYAAGFIGFLTGNGLHQVFFENCHSIGEIKYGAGYSTLATVPAAFITAINTSGTLKDIHGAVNVGGCTGKASLPAVCRFDGDATKGRDARHTVGFTYATVSGDVATYVVDDTIVTGGDYKLMVPNNLAINLVAASDGTALTTTLNTNGLLHAGIASVDANINNLTAVTNNSVITWTTQVKTPANDVYVVDGDANTGNVKIDSGFVTSLDGCSGFNTPELRAANAAKIQEELNKGGANGIPQWMNYAMGLSTASKKAGENDKPIAAAKQDANPNSIKLSLAGLNPPANIGAKVRYEVTGMSGAAPKNYGEDLDINISALGFDASTKFKAITIKVIVDQTNAEAKK